MKTLRNEGIVYEVKNSEQAKYLEDAVNGLPLEVEIASFSDSFKPPIHVSEMNIDDKKIILIRPSQGIFSKIKFEKKVKVIKVSEDYTESLAPLERFHFLTCKPRFIAYYKGNEYHISNEPEFGI